jgi:hypothetical protein
MAQGLLLNLQVKVPRAQTAAAEVGLAAVPLLPPPAAAEAELALPAAVDGAAQPPAEQVPGLPCTAGTTGGTEAPAEEAAAAAGVCTELKLELKCKAAALGHDGDPTALKVCNQGVDLEAYDGWRIVFLKLVSVRQCLAIIQLPS